MNTPVSRLSGVMSPVLTPFNSDLTPSPSRFVKHCRWLLKQEVGLAIFGTNSEANSLTVKEKASLLDALLAAGLPAAKMMPGTGTCALPDTIELTRRAVEAGCGGVLMLPPFYYKGVSDEGLYRSFARVIDAVADDRLRIYLYHIPPVSQVPITLTLIERLLKAFPGIIAGVKDSSGDWNNTAAMLKDSQPLRDYSSPQGQDRCTVDVDVSASAHWFQRDFRRVLRSDCSVGGALPRSRRTPMPSPADRHRLDLRGLPRN
jgi:4-hydroxy-tetrahydrodipicolinate synthase